MSPRPASAPLRPDDGSRSIKADPSSLPELRTIAPAIFIPITEDLTAPIPPIPSSTSSRLRCAIERHNDHTKTVQANISNYYRREVYRLSSLPQPPPRVPPTLSEKDRTTLLSNLEAPSEPGREYSLAQELIPTPVLSNIADPAMRLLGKLTKESAEYRAHAEKKRQKLTVDLRAAELREEA